MGGVASCVYLRQEAGAGRLPDVPILMLLDRTADIFLARRASADGWVVKPLDAFGLRRAATAILEGHPEPDPQPEPEPMPVADVNPQSPASTAWCPVGPMRYRQQSSQ